MTGSEVRKYPACPSAITHFKDIWDLFSLWPHMIENDYYSKYVNLRHNNSIQTIVISMPDENRCEFDSSVTDSGHAMSHWYWLHHIPKMLTIYTPYHTFWPLQADNVLPRRFQWSAWSCQSQCMSQQGLSFVLYFDSFGYVTHKCSVLVPYISSHSFFVAQAHFTIINVPASDCFLKKVRSILYL